MESHREWEEETRESRQELAEGKGVTFPNAQEAKRWLREDDKEGDKEKRNMTDSHDMDDMGEWVLGPVNLPGERSSFLALTLPREAVSNTITIDASTHAGLLRESLVEHAEIWRALS